jgi:hypothetical protein
MVECTPMRVVRNSASTSDFCISRGLRLCFRAHPFGIIMSWDLQWCSAWILQELCSAAQARPLRCRALLPSRHHCRTCTCDSRRSRKDILSVLLNVLQQAESSETPAVPRYLPDSLPYTPQGTSSCLSETKSYHCLHMYVTGRVRKGVRERSRARYC